MQVLTVTPKQSMGLLAHICVLTAHGIVSPFLQSATDLSSDTYSFPQYLPKGTYQVEIDDGNLRNLRKETYR